MDETEIIWNNRFSYLKSCGIQIMNKNEIVDNVDLQLKCIKNNEIQWGFSFV